MSKATKKSAGAPPGELSNIPLGEIRVSADNPRKHFRDDALEELARSIEAVGVLEPILVRRLEGDGPHRYEIVAGERRYRASQLAKLASIPAIVRVDAEATVEAIRLIENLEREDLTACETADGYRRLLDVHGLTVEDLAAKIGVTPRSIEQQLTLTRLGMAARALVDGGSVDKTVAVRAASIPDADAQEAFLRTCAQRKHSFKDAEELLRTTYQRSLTKAQFSTKDATLFLEAGACTTCPFKVKNVCTNLACWAAKDDAYWERSKAQAEGAGLKVLSASAQKKAFPPSYPHDYLANWESKLEDLDEMLGKHVWVGGVYKPIKDLVTDEQIGGLTAGEVSLGRYQSGRVARLVPRAIAEKIAHAAEGAGRKAANVKKAAAGKGGEVSGETKRRHLQADVRKASEELYPMLADTLDRKASPPEGEGRTKYTILECANMLRAHLVWYLTNLVMDGNRRPDAARALCKDMLGVDPNRGYTGTGSYEKFLARQRDEVATGLAALPDARLCEFLIRAHTEDAHGRNYDSTKLTAWMLSACALHEVDAPAVLAKHFDARTAAYKEASRKAKERADKQKAASKATAPAKAAKKSRRDPDETPAGRKAKRLGAEIAKLDAYDGVDPPSADDLETIDVEVLDESEVERIVGAVEEELDREVEHQVVDASADVPFSRWCRGDERPAETSDPAFQLFWRMHDAGLLDPRAPEVEKRLGQLPENVEEQDLIDDAGAELDILEGELIEALDDPKTREGFEAMMSAGATWPVGYGVPQEAVTRYAGIRDRRATIDACDQRKRADLEAEDAQESASLDADRSASATIDDDPLVDCGPCRVCGCTADDPCPQGCERQETTLCTACAVLSPRELHEFSERRRKLLDLEVGSKQRFNKGRDLDRDVLNARTQRAMARA